MKKWFNRHKLKRKWQRRVGKSRENSLERVCSVSARRYSGENPYRSAQDASSRKRIIEVAVLCLILVSLFGIFLFNPFFHVSKVTVEGLQRIDQQEFFQTVDGAIVYKKFGFLPAQSYFFVSTDKLHELLTSKYSIESLSIRKHFPQSLNFSVEEKISTVIFDNGEQYSYLDVGGKLIEILREVGDDEWVIEHEVTTTTLADGTIRTEERMIKKDHKPPVDLLRSELGSYPIVYSANASKPSEEGAVLDSRKVQNAILWFTLLQKRSDVKFSYMTLGTVDRHATIHTDEGWGIQINIFEEPSLQFERLQNVLTKVSRSSLQYIDIRFAERVYWQ